MIKNLLLLFLATICFSSYGQITPHFTLVTTAFSKDTSANGQDMEYIQLLVDGNKSCTEKNSWDSLANISNFVIYDKHGNISYNNGTKPGIASGYYRFPNTPTWNSVPFGSIIVIYNDNNKNTSAITYPDDSLGIVNPHVYVVPVSWLELSSSSPFVFDSLQTILPLPPDVTFGFGQNAYLNTPIYADTVKYSSPQYPPFNRNDFAKWTVVNANMANTTAGSFYNNLLISWVDSINKASGAPIFKISIDTSNDNSCSAAVILKASSSLPANSLTYEWRINDTLVTSNSTNTLIDTLRSRDYISLKVTTSLTCVTAHKTFDSSLIFYSPGFLQVAISPNIVGQNVSIDSVGKDLQGNLDSSRVFKSFYCTGDTITFTATPNHSYLGDNYQWFVNHTPVSNDSIFKDSLVKNLDTIQCILTSGLQCGVIPLIDTTTIYIFKNTPLNVIKIPKITISGLTGISGDKIIDVYFKDTFSVKFHYDSTLKGVNGLDSILSIDSSKKITAKNCDPKLKDTLITYDTTFAHYVDSSARYRLVWVLNGVPIDTSITFKDGDHIPSFPYSNFYNSQDTLQCILLAKKTSSCPYDEDFTLRDTSNRMIMQNQSFHLLTTSLARGVNDGEYIQLLVGGTRDCNEKNKKFLYQADLSGFVIYDKNGASTYSTTNTNGLASGRYRFRSRPGEWYTKVPFGSIILIHNDAPYSNSLIGYGDETTGTAIPLISGFASRSNVYIISRSSLELIPESQVQIPPPVLKSNFSSPTSLNLKDGEIAYLNSRITPPFVNSDSCKWDSHWSTGLDGATLDFAGYFPNSRPDLQNWQREYLSYGVVPDIKLVSTEDLDATNINCNPIRIKYSLNSSAVAKLDTVIWYIRHFDTLATKYTYPINSYKDTTIFNLSSQMTVSPDSAKSYSHRDSSFSQIHYKDELFAYIHSPYYCILDGGEPAITRPIIKSIISANQTWTIPYVDSVSFSINTDEPDRLHYLRPIKGTDTVGTDALGNKLNTRVYKTFCKGDTIRLNAVSNPKDLTKKYSYNWFRLSGNTQTLLSHVPDIIKPGTNGEADTTISMDSVLDVKSIPAGVFYDTLICTLHNSQTCAIPYISDTIYIRLLDSIPIPTITITGMKGINNDTNICSAMTDSFSVAFHYIADTIRAADGSPLKAVDGITDSVIYKKDTTTRYALVWEVWNSSSQPQVRNSVYYNPSDPAYHPNTDPLSVTRLDSTIYSDDSTGAKTIRDSIGFLYNKFVAMPNSLQNGDSVRCILFARKTNSCPYDKDSFLVSPFTVWPVGSCARDSILADTVSSIVTPLRNYSNIKVMNITPSFAPTIKIFSKGNIQQFLCPNDILARRNRQDSVIFWATDSVSSAGDRPSYLWFVDSAGTRRMLDSTNHPNANAYLYDSSIHSGTDSNYAISFHRDSADLNIPPSTIPQKDTISFQNFYGGKTFKQLYPGDTLCVKLINNTSNCLLFDSAVARIPLDTLSPVLTASIIPVEPQLICAYDTLVTTKFFKDTVINSSKNAPYPPRYWWVSNNGNVTWMDTLSGAAPDTFHYNPVLHTGDTIYMKVFSNIACIQNDSIVALPYSVSITPNFYDSVWLPTRDTLCFSVQHSVSAILSANAADPANGDVPTFDWWLKDGGTWTLIAANTSSTYTFNTDASNMLHDGDSAYCVMHGNATCVVATKTDTSNMIYFHVNPLPIVNPITGPTVICVGSFKYLLETTPKGVWVSNDPNTLDVDQTGKITGVNAGGASVQYSVTDSNNCYTITPPYAVTVNANPDSTIIGVNSPLCIGSTNQLSTSNGSGNWTSSNPAVATVDNSGLVTAIKQGVVTITNTFTDIACGTTIRSANLIIGTPIVDTIKGVHSLCSIVDTLTFKNDSIGGIWASTYPSTAIIDPNSGFVNAVNLGITTITYSIANSCGNTTQSYFLTVGKPIIGDNTGQNTICKQYHTTLTNTALAGGGVWSSSDPKVATINPVSGDVLGIDSGSATITYTMTNSCGDTTATILLSVQNALPLQPIVGDTILCKGISENLSHPIKNGKWISSDTSVATIDSISGTVTGVNNGLVTVGYVIQNTCGVDTIKLNMVVGPPIVGSYTFKNPMCVNDTIILTNNTRGATGFQWIVSDPNIARLLNINSDTLYGVHFGTTSIFYNPTNACSQFNFHQTSLTVLDTPHIAAIQGFQDLCLNSTAQFSNKTLSGSWRSVDSTIASISNSGFVNAVAVGSTIIQYKVTDNNGCSNISAAPLKIDTLPVLPVITGNDTACFGRTTALANAYNSTGIWKGKWTSADELKAQVDSISGVVSGIAVGQTKVSYTVTDGNGCKQKVDTLISVNPIPSVQKVTGNDSVCINSGILLTNTTPNGIWYSDAPSIATIDSIKGVVTGNSSGSANITYKVTVLGCDSVVAHRITVNINNVSEITGISNMCRFAETYLKNPTTGGTGIKWTSDSASIVTIQGVNNLDSVKVFGKGVGTDTIRYSVNNNCGTTIKSFAITIGAPKVLPIVGLDSICVGKKTTYTSLTQVNSGDTAVWFSDNTNIATIDSASGLINGLVAGTGIMRFKVTSTGGCYDTVAKAITIVSLPTVASITGNSILCLKSTEPLQNSTPNGVWSATNANLSIDPTTGSITGVSKGLDSIYYQVTNSFGCINTNGPFIIDVKPLPIIAPIKYDSLRVNVGLTLNLTDDSLNGKRLWYSEDNNYLTVINKKDTGVVTGGNNLGFGTIYYKLTDLNGCSDSVSVKIEVIGQLNDIYIPNFLAPAATQVENKTFSVYGKYAKSLDLKIFNQWGEVVYSSSSIKDNKWDGKYKGEYQPSGVYVYVAKLVLITGETIVKKGAVNLIR